MNAAPIGEFVVYLIAMFFIACAFAVVLLKLKNWQIQQREYEQNRDYWLWRDRAQQKDKP